VPPFTLDGNFDNNALTASSTTDNAFGMALRSNFVITGNFSNNTFTIESTSGNAAGVIFIASSSGSIASSGAIDGNTFDVISSIPGNYGAFSNFLNSSFSLYNIQNNDFSGSNTTNKILLAGGGTINIYGATDAQDLVDNNTGLTLANITDSAVTYNS